MVNPFTSGPIALYRNLPIEPQNYMPSRFEIDDVILGLTTKVSTIPDTNYVIGQQVRLLIPIGYGCTQLNGLTGYVLDFDFTTDTIDYFFPLPFTFIPPVLTYDLFVDITPSFPDAAIIPGTLKVYLVNKIFGSFVYADNGLGSLVKIEGIGPINPIVFGTIDYATGSLVLTMSSNPQDVLLSSLQTNFTINFTTAEKYLDISIDSSQNVSEFIDIEADTPPEVLAIGDIGSGGYNRMLSIPGSFINISPN